MPSPAPWEADTPLSGPVDQGPPMLPEQDDDGRSFGQGALDALKAGGSGLLHGATDLLGIPMLPVKALNWIGGLFGHEGDIINDQWFDDTMGMLHSGLDDMVYQPQNEGEQAIENVASFLPGSLLGPGSVASKVTRFGIAPGLVSEGAGQMFDDTGAENTARTVGALLGGIGGAVVPSIGGGTNRAARAMLPGNMTQADLEAAQQLMTTSQQMGIQLTWPEAIHRATNGRINVTDVQRFIESSRGGAPTMADFMARRPGQVANAVESQTRTMGPQVDFATAGLQVQSASKEAVSALNERINAVTRPLYDAAAPQVIHPMALAQLQRDPLFQQALGAVRNSPVYGRLVQGYPDGSVQVLDAVKKYLDDLGQDMPRTGASIVGGVAGDVRGAAAAASPEYAAALRGQTDLRGQFLNPAEAGPLGRMGATDQLATQVDVMFPRSPFVGSETVVAETVRRVAAQDPVAAQTLVRSYIEREFDNASRNIMSGENQWSGARFANEVVGSRQQALNLQAAIYEAFPADAAVRWEGFQELLRVLEATGARQRPGSATQANLSFADQYAQGGRMGELATTVSSPGAALTFVKDTYRRIVLTGNTRRMADVMTNPNAGPLFEQLLAARNTFDKTRIAAALIQQTYLADAMADRPPPMLQNGGQPWGGDTPMLLPSLDELLN